MKQITFTDAEYAGKHKQTRKELFLIEMDQVVPWKGLVALIEPHYPKSEGGRPAYLPWHFLYFKPEPHQQRSLRPTFTPGADGT